MNVHDGHATKQEGQKVYKKNIFMPNEFFDDLHEEMEGKKSSHIAFAYSYYYFITYLYRYSVYGSSDPLYTQDRIKSELGYHSKNKSIDYIVKKTGLLDQIGYTRTTSDYPIHTSTEYEDNGGIINYDFEFVLNSELNIGNFDLNGKNQRNFKIKYPIKAFYRDEEAQSDTHLNGTFYDVENTHSISIDTFRMAMRTEGIGCEGFYLFAFLKMKNETHSHLPTYVGGYSIVIELLSAATRIKIRTLHKLIKALEQNGFIQVQRDKRMRSKDEGYKVDPNIYFVLVFICSHSL